MQYSAFEHMLDEKGLGQMQKAVKRVIRPKVERVRFYYLCAACVPKTEVTLRRRSVERQAGNHGRLTATMWVGRRPSEDRRSGGLRSPYT